LSKKIINKSGMPFVNLLKIGRATYMVILTSHIGEEVKRPAKGEHQKHAIEREAIGDSSNAEWGPSA
jgi:hypothetical protein